MKADPRARRSPTESCAFFAALNKAVEEEDVQQRHDATGNEANYSSEHRAARN